MISSISVANQQMWIFSKAYPSGERHIVVLKAKVNKKGTGLDLLKSYFREVSWKQYSNIWSETGPKLFPDYFFFQQGEFVLYEAGMTVSLQNKGWSTLSEGDPDSKGKLILDYGKSFGKIKANKLIMGSDGGWHYTLNGKLIPLSSVKPFAYVAGGVFKYTTEGKDGKDKIITLPKNSRLYFNTKSAIESDLLYLKWYQQISY